MWVTKDVNIPRPLLDAAEEDKVVSLSEREHRLILPPTYPPMNS